MKRQLTFDFENGKYVLKEDNNVVFSIDGRELKFVSLDFYNGVYKNKSAAIELIDAVSNDELKKGRYIFEWLTEIVAAVQAELNDPEIEEYLEDKTLSEPSKVVYLFELSACAGDGFYSEGPSSASQEVDAPYPDADYAIKISGKSMEPTIEDGSIVFVKVVNELQDGDVGIFVVDGNVMCKRFRDEQGKRWLQPDNDSKEFSPIILRDNVNCIIQGKVLLP
jgi:repressor LexA